MPTLLNPAIPIPAGPETARAELVLLCRVRSWFCALPVAHVEETMRPLPVGPLAAAPAFVTGLSIIRGRPTPVVDTGALLGARDEAHPRRLVVLRLGERRVALAVEEVLGVRALSGATLHRLPPLLSEAGRDAVSAIGALDDALLLALDAGRLVPQAVWDAVAVGGAAP
ncbi:MAG TPA: chemotaxis protein CheW [Polyangia bacterium]|nr:chemotaxis protein CheW [Polyangia bacterium]